MNATAERTAARAAVTCDDCGGACVPSGISTGWARFVDAEGKNRRVCYGCAAERELTNAQATGRLFAYVSQGRPRRVTTWPGRTLSDRVAVGLPHRDNMGGSRRPIRFVMPDGSLWHGWEHLSAGNYARCRRSTRRVSADDWLAWR